MPGPDRRVTLADVREKGWAALFAPDVPEPMRLVVELGFGRGEFLRALAAEAKDVAHVGVDRRRAGAEDGATHREDGGAEHPPGRCHGRGAWWRARWPRPAWRRSGSTSPTHGPRSATIAGASLQPGFVALLASRLAPGGELQAATDHADYAAHIDLVLAAEPRLENALATPFVAEVPGRLCTAYEAMWRAEGRALHFFTYRRRSEP